MASRTWCCSTITCPEWTASPSLERIRATPADASYLPVLMLTGDSSAPVRRRSLAAGASDFVAKPIEMDEVLLRIRNLLEIRCLHRRMALQNQLLETPGRRTHGRAR